MFYLTLLMIDLRDLQCGSLSYPYSFLVSARCQVPMTTTITITPPYPAQPVYEYAQAPLVHAPPPTVASSYAAGASLPQYASLPAIVPAPVSNRVALNRDMHPRLNSATDLPLPAAQTS